MTTSVETPPVAVPSVPPARATFGDAARAELLKLTSVRSTWITLALTLALGIGLGALISYLAGSQYSAMNLGDKAAWDPTAVSFFSLTIAQLAIAVLGVMIVTSEYSTGMIRVSLSAVPRRSRFLAAKAVVFTAVALVVGEATAVGAFLVGQAVIGSNAPHTNLAAHGVLRAVIGAGLYLAVIGLLATAVGTLVRSTAAGISAVVALLFVLPGVVQALPSSWSNPITEWWPTQAGSQIYVLHRDAHTLAAWSGLGVLVLFAAIVLTAANYVLRRRDA